MDKLTTIQRIAHAKVAHENQMKKIVALLNKKEVENLTPADKMECEFGLWLYNRENRLREILGVLFYTNLDTIHTRWHEEYLKIYDIFFKPKSKKGFLSKMFKINAVDDMTLDKAKLYYSELEATSDELLRMLGSSQRRIEALKEEKFI